MRERLNRAVSKTVEPLRVPWVRIPPSPPFRINDLQWLTFYSVQSSQISNGFSTEILDHYQ